LLAGGVLLAGIITWSVFFTGSDSRLFAIFTFSQCLLFLSIPCKQVANGLQRFGILCWMSVTANMIRLIGIAGLAFYGRLTMQSIAILFAIAAAAELVVCLVLYRWGLQLRFSPRYNYSRHVALIKESTMQLGITVCNVLVSRADWVLLGMLTAAPFVADYSFAYRFFEFSVFPVYILGPVLLPRIVRLFTPGHRKIRMPNLP
jgi:O-antigen/teichoic acid export membrane protein